MLRPSIACGCLRFAPALIPQLSTTVFASCALLERHPADALRQAAWTRRALQSVEKQLADPVVMRVHRLERFVRKRIECEVRIFLLDGPPRRRRFLALAGQAEQRGAQQEHAAGQGTDPATCASLSVKTAR
jgi:hypothetical protein